MSPSYSRCCVKVSRRHPHSRDGDPYHRCLVSSKVRVPQLGSTPGVGTGVRSVSPEGDWTEVWGGGPDLAVRVQGPPSPQEVEGPREGVRRAQDPSQLRPLRPAARPSPHGAEPNPEDVVLSEVQVCTLLVQDPKGPRPRAPFRPSGPRPFDQGSGRRWDGVVTNLRPRQGPDPPYPPDNQVEETVETVYQ